MKKIYSFVLMAAALLVGTNASAIDVSNGSDLQAAITAAGDGEEIEVVADLTVGSQIVLDADKYIILDLNDNEITVNNENGADNAGILIKHGRLRIKSTGSSKDEPGKITNGSAKTYDLIRLLGTNTAIDAKEATPYSQVIVEENVKIVNTTYANAIVICETSGTGGYNLANGARIDVYGKLEATKYGIKVNGNVKDPQDFSMDRNNSPFVYIHAGSEVKASNASSAVAAYSSGYARWRVEGTCLGSTGLYAKSGDVEIVNATIASTQSSTVTTQTGKGSGVSAGGSAIVIESNASYPGHTEVVISGEQTHIQGNGGYAIEETIANGTSGKVESVSIQGGTLTGGSAGAIIVEKETNEGKKVTVVGGTVDGSIGIDETTDPTAPVVTPVTIVEFVNGTNNIEQAGQEDLDYLVTIVEAQGTTPAHYEVQPNLSKVVTMNAYGWSTFSANAARALVNGVTAYKAAYSDEGNVQLLTLTPLVANNPSDPFIIPAEEGVILFGTPNATYSLNSTNETPSHLANNDLYPASEWSATYQHKENYDFYVLHDNQMYLYTGETMKANKAYLPISKVGLDAPRRIQMVIAETQDIENVEFEAVKAVKFIENGQVLIKRGEKVYNVQGQIVK